MRSYDETWFSFTFELLNSNDLYYKETERLENPEQLRELLQKHGLFFDEIPDMSDVRVLQACRDKLRQLIRSGSDEDLGGFLSERQSLAPIQSYLHATGKGSFEFVFEVPNRNSGSLAERIWAVCTFALGSELVRLGRLRLKSCSSPPCEEIFMDYSKNGLQRFCCKRCSTRFFVKKHRNAL